MTLAEKLKEEALQSLADWEAEALLNALDPSLPVVRSPIQAGSARAVLFISGYFGGLEIAAGSHPSAALRGAAITCLRSLDNLQTPMIRLDNPEVYAAVSACLAGLVSGGLLDTQTKDKLLALGDRQQSWADVYNDGQPVTARDVGLARGARP